MNKTDLIKKTKDLVVAKKTEEDEKEPVVTLKEAGVYVDAVLEAIGNALVDEEKILLVGFGSFETVERHERMARNPRTGEECLVKASKAVKFKAAKALKEAVNA